MNGQRNMHYRKTAKLVKLWRTASRVHCAGLDAVLSPVDVVVDLYLRGKRSQDVGACYPAVKAAIDGIVDAGILADDTPEYVQSIRMNSPVLGSKADMMRITLWA